jgi:hypothetical protein
VLCASVDSEKKWVLKPFYPEVRIPVTKGLLQALIEHLSTHLQHQMRTFLCPLHLLLFGKPLTSQFATILSRVSSSLSRKQWMFSILSRAGATFTFADSPSHKCLSHFIIVLLWHDWEQKGWNCQRCSDSD